MKGRTILTNIQTARSALECCDVTSGHVAMVYLDLEKAFDKVAHTLLFAPLEHINTGKLFEKGFKWAYAN